MTVPRLFDTRDCPRGAVVGFTHKLLQDVLRGHALQDGRLDGEHTARCPACGKHVLEVSLLRPDAPALWDELIEGIWWRCRRGCTEAARLEAIEPERKPLAAELEDELAIDRHARPESHLERIEREQREADRARQDRDPDGVTVRRRELVPDSPAPPPSAVILDKYDQRVAAEKA